MTSQAQSMDNQNHIEDEDDWVSKSQLKRDSKSLQSLGKTLATFSDDQLSKVPLEEKLLDAIELARRLSNKRGALKRHFQYFGKLLRSVDVDPILEAVAIIEDTDNASKLIFKQIEYWRDRILTEGDQAINECCEQYPYLQRQTLRQLWRNHKQVTKDEKKVVIARQLFKELRSTIEG